LERGSGLGGPLHCFCGAGGIREGLPVSIQRLTCSLGGQGENRLIGWVNGGHRVGPIWMRGVGCKGGMINGGREMGVVL